MKLLPRHRRELREILTQGSVSRTGLVSATGIRRNTVYDDVYGFLSEGLVREAAPSGSGPGRPRVPLEIDPDQRHVLGVSFQIGCVQAGRLNLLGEPCGETLTHEAGPADAMRVAAELVKRLLDTRTLALGVSIPGFIDREKQVVVFSSVFHGESSVSLEPLLALAGQRPVVFETEAHAVAARWLLEHSREAIQDTLLIYFEDGSLGAAFIVNGRPNRGCIIGANELGHTRLCTETRRCYCGGTGCLERICDSTYLRDNGFSGSLSDALRSGAVSHPVMKEAAGLLGIGFANAINFTRAGRVVIASQLAGSGRWIEAIAQEARGQLMGELKGRVQIQSWPEAQARSAGTSAYLALTSLYYEDW